MDIEVEPEYVSFAGWVKDDKEIYIINEPLRANYIRPQWFFSIKIIF